MDTNFVDFFSAVCEEIRANGLDAGVENTGGGIVCITVFCDPYMLYFGTANDTWGADVWLHDEFQDGLYVETNIPISPDDMAANARAILYGALRFGRCVAAAKEEDDLTASVGNSHGYLCPKCKSGESLRIAARVWVDLLPLGVDKDNSDTEWDGTSNALCSTCQWDGKVSDLLTVEADDNDAPHPVTECVERGCVESELVSASREALTTLRLVHDTHIFAPGDPHPADCQYCAVAPRLQIALDTHEEH